MDPKINTNKKWFNKIGVFITPQNKFIVRIVVTKGKRSFISTISQHTTEIEAINKFNSFENGKFREN